MAVFEFNRYERPSGPLYSIVPLTASLRFNCPWTVPVQMGEWESSKSAMYTSAPLFKALIIIFRSTGPVISTRLFSKSDGICPTVQSPSRTLLVSIRKSGSLPMRALSALTCRCFSKSSNLSPNSKTRVATKLSASLDSMLSNPGSTGPWI